VDLFLQANDININLFFHSIRMLGIFFCRQVEVIGRLLMLRLSFWIQFSATKLLFCDILTEYYFSKVFIGITVNLPSNIGKGSMK
jgi:hypothetical protein